MDALLRSGDVILVSPVIYKINYSGELTEDILAECLKMGYYGDIQTNSDIN